MPDRSIRPVIFVFVEGVLRSARSDWVSKTDVGSLDPVAVNLLRELCTRALAEVVIVSPWSSHFPTAVKWNETLGLIGVAPLPIAGVFPGLDILRARDKCDALVVNYVKDYALTNYAILSDGFRFHGEHPRLVRVDSSIGLTLTDLLVAAEVLEADAELLSELRSYTAYRGRVT